jgi:hypothetical protein
MIKIKTLISAKIFASVILLIETLFLILNAQLFFFELGFLNLSRYGHPVQSDLASGLVWLVPHLLIFIIILGFWWWEWGDGARWSAIGTLSLLTILDIVLFASIFTGIIWIFTIYLVIRSPPKIVRKLKEINSAKSGINRKQFFGFLLLLPLLIPCVPYLTLDQVTPSLRELKYPSGDFSTRKEIVRNDSLLYTYNHESQLIRAYLGLPLNEIAVLQNVEDIKGEDGADFTMNYFLRMLYLDNQTHVLSSENRTVIENALLYGKYWFTEEGSDEAIYWTENHQIAYHTAELLAGQFFKDNIFTRSSMNGTEHITHAEYMITKWINWRARFGFSEYHSNTYLNIDMLSLINLVDFAQNSTISLKASMLLDLICFDFANNWYQDIYATAHGRCYGETKIPYFPGDSPKREEIAEPVWILLNLGGHYSERAPRPITAFIVTSDKYTPPPILEKIAQDAKENNENKDRNSIDIAEAGMFGINFTEEDLMFWWGMAAPINQATIDISFEVIDKYNLDPALICGGPIPDILKGLAKTRGITVSEYAGLIKEFTQGLTLETANTYTYRTPYYQLSGLQDHHKGLNSIQEHIWQASLSSNAYVFTNAPGGMNWKGGPFMGGWLPKATFYRNIGILQYDHHHEALEAVIIADTVDSILNVFTNNRPYNHAYFPRWAFDEVRSVGKWTLGSKDGGYVALYSYHPTFWVSNYELAALGRSNVWIVEMGSITEYGSFDEFVNQITSADVDIHSEEMGYGVTYKSPSQGKTTVGWTAPLIVNGSIIDLGPYERFENKYSNAQFNSFETIIEFNTERLTLNFENNTRLYEI